MTDKYTSHRKKKRNTIRGQLRTLYFKFKSILKTPYILDNKTCFQFIQFIKMIL
jgi:hypothetical protein